MVFVPLAVAFLILLWGSVMRHTDEHSLAPSWPSRVVTGLLIAQLLTAIGVVYIMEGYRKFAAFAVLLEQWIGLAIGFVAAMSVTGDWL